MENKGIWKMNLAKKSVQENGYYSEEEVKAVLDKV